MQVIFSEKHKLRNAETELYGGELVSPFEAPFRAEWILESVKKAGHQPVDSPDSFDLKIAHQIHDSGYLSFMETAWQRWKELGYKGEAIPTSFPVRRMQQNRVPRDVEGALGYYCMASETSISKGTWEGALSSMEVALTGARFVVDSGSSCFSLCRPPGHHCSIDQYGGYCFINNAAVAAQYLLNQGVKRVGILDVDFHHGNGTQDIFYARDDVFFASIHGDPSDTFPHFLGYADETGSGAGEGANINYPLPPGTPFSVWRAALKDSLSRIRNHGCEALVVSLGVDTFENDPISFFKLTSDDFTRYGEMIKASGLPTLFCLEGGYGVKEIGLNVANVLNGFESA